MAVDRRSFGIERTTIGMIQSSADTGQVAADACSPQTNFIRGNESTTQKNTGRCFERLSLDSTNARPGEVETINFSSIEVYRIINVASNQFERIRNQG